MTVRLGLALTALALVLGTAGTASATPDMSLTAGTPCIACHVNTTGGGGRTTLGWETTRHAGALTFDQLGLQSLHDVESSGYFDDLFAVGLDFRLQAARLGNPTLDESGPSPEVIVPDVTVFPMQLQPYISIWPTAGLSIYGTFLAGPETFNGKLCDEAFPGMPCFEAFAQYEPTGIWPTVRAGQFQPAIGIRHDDHTLFIRGDARDRRRPIIPPNYAEPGAEVMFQPITWLRAEAGAFLPTHLDDALNETSETAKLSPVSVSARLTFLPYIKIPIAAEDDGFGDDGFGNDGFGDEDFGDDFGDDGPATNDYIINSWFGASFYGSGDFLMLTGFMGLGIHEGVSLVAEVSHTQRTIEYETLNGWVGLWYTPWDWLTFSIRGERAQTTTANDEDTALSVVGGVEFLPLPYLEIRPEYRLVETDSFRFGQATVQFHMFY